MNRAADARPASSARIEFANTLRGVAALSVVFAHLFSTYWAAGPVVEWLTGVHYVSAPMPWAASVARATGIDFGGFGVSLFFVISGFVIPFSFERYSARGFLVARLLRIWPTYWAGLSVTILAVLAGVHLTGGAVPFGPKDAAIHYFPPLRAIADSRPIDAIMWTLEIEMFFYLVCCAAADWLRRPRWTLVLFPLGLFGLWLAADLTSAHFAGNAALVSRLRFLACDTSYLVFMFCGVALHLLHRRKIGLLAAGGMIAFCYGLFALAQIFGAFPAKSSPLWFLIGLGVFILCMRFEAYFQRNRITTFLSDISYPLYIVHGVAGFVLLHVLTGAGWNSGLALAFTVGCVLIVAWAIHVLVEEPTHRIGQKIARMLTTRDATPAAKTVVATDVPAAAEAGLPAA